MKTSTGVYRKSQEEQWHRKPGDSSALAKGSWQGSSQDVGTGLAELWQGQLDLGHTEQIPAEVPMISKASVPLFPASGILV